MAGELLVLLLPLVVEDQDFLGAALFEHAGEDAGGVACGARELAFGGAGGENIGKFKLAVLGGLAFDVNDVAGRDAILLASGADDRVHSASKLPGRMK